jgi:hypothetical protein
MCPMSNALGHTRELEKCKTNSNWESSKMKMGTLQRPTNVTRKVTREGTEDEDHINEGKNPLLPRRALDRLNIQAACLRARPAM